MYIEPMRPHAPASPSRPHPVGFARFFRMTGAACFMLTLAGCLFDDEPPAKAIPRPSTLDPETDAFRDANVRQYSWTENLVRAGKTDTLLSQGSYELRYTRDTVLAGETRPFFDLSASYTANSPAPASLLARSGFRPARVHFDTLRMPDPGPSYRFPDTPLVGWRLDTVVGDVRFVRRLKGVETIAQYGRRHETWAFAESTWWQGDAPVLMGVGITWMGRTGLVKHESRWPGFPSSAGQGTLRRTLVASP